MQDMRKDSIKIRRLASLFIFWLFMAIVAAIFAYVLYSEGIEYPATLVGPERLRDAIYGIYAVVFVSFIACAIWFFIWKAYWSNQTIFDETLTEEEKSVSHAVEDVSLPLSLRGNLLRINRGFSIETIDTNVIFWIRADKICVRDEIRGLTLYLYSVDGKKTKALFSRENVDGVLHIIERIKKDKPNILISEGFLSEEYKKCKYAYENRI